MFSFVCRLMVIKTSTRLLVFMRLIETGLDRRTHEDEVLHIERLAAGLKLLMAAIHYAAKSKVRKK